MKRIVLLSIGVFFLYYVMHAQSLKVIYNEKIQMDSVNIKVDDPALAELIRSSLNNQSKKTYLLFNDGESIYEDSKEEVKDKNITSENIMINFSVQSGAIVYKNHKTNQQVSQEYILDRPFLINESLKKFDWALVDEEKIIKDYKCKKAVFDSVVAWYTTEIPIKEGPLYFCGLPGLILKLEISKLNIEADSIITEINKDDLVVPPAKGKQITREKFEKMFKKKNKQFEGKTQSQGVSIVIESY